MSNQMAPSHRMPTDVPPRSIITSCERIRVEFVTEPRHEGDTLLRHKPLLGAPIFDKLLGIGRRKRRSGSEAPVFRDFRELYP